MRVPSLSKRLYDSLREDEAFSDITTQNIPGAKTTRGKARVISRKQGVFCGRFLIAPLFKILSKKIRLKRCVADGARIRKDQVIAELSGPIGPLLSGERVFLNLASHLSGIATLTSTFIQKMGASKVTLTDTRKTTPYWRDLEKFAVRCGGGTNHRFDLNDAVLVKDNHIQILRSMGIAPSQVYRHVKKKGQFLEVEAKTLRDVWEGIKTNADLILLDNMTPTRLKEAIAFIKASRTALNRPSPLIEISGGVSLKTIRSLSKLGADRISIGALTHSAPALDLSLEVY